MTDPRLAFYAKAVRSALISAVLMTASALFTFNSALPRSMKLTIGVVVAVAWGNVLIQYRERRRAEAGRLPQGRPAIPLFHQVFLVGLIVLTAGTAVLHYFRLAPVLPRDEVAATMAYALASISVVLTIAAVAVFRPRVPGRPAGQTVDEYWLTPAVATRALPVVFLLELAGTLAWVGYFLTGLPVTIAAVGLTLAGMWRCRPDSFARP